MRFQVFLYLWSVTCCLCIYKIRKVVKTEVSNPKRYSFLKVKTRPRLLICLIYIYAFSRRFYPKQLSIQAIHLICFISMCVPWELNPQLLALLTQCSTTEPQEHPCHLNTPDMSTSLCWKIYTTTNVYAKKEAELAVVLLSPPPCRGNIVWGSEQYGKGCNFSFTSMKYSANHNALDSRPIRSHLTF